MLRDGVCDEVANNQTCFFDGGDCCLEFKNVDFCRNCSCILAVDYDKLLADFRDQEIMPLNNANGFNVLDGTVTTVKVDEVISRQVCAVLCLDHEKVSNINAWHYISEERVCKCGWIQSDQCLEQMVDRAWEFHNLSSLTASDTFVQLKKTVACGEQELSALIAFVLLTTLNSF